MNEESTIARLFVSAQGTAFFGDMQEEGAFFTENPDIPDRSAHPEEQRTEEPIVRIQCGRNEQSERRRFLSAKLGGCKRGNTERANGIPCRTMDERRKTRQLWLPRL